MKRLFLVCLCLAANNFSNEISEKQEKSIEFILSSLAKKNSGALLLDSIHLRSCGNEIQPIPPLIFLSYIISHPDLKENLLEIEKRYFSWYMFISGFRNKCNQKKQYNKIKRDLENFANEIDENVNLLEEYVYSKDWDGLVKYLIHR